MTESCSTIGEKLHAMRINRSIILSKYNVEVDNGVIYLPLYMAPLIVECCQ